MSRAQIRPSSDFDRPRWAAPTMRVQYHYPVRYREIRGSYRVSIMFEAPAIVWGKDGRFWAFLHDFAPEAYDRILEDCRQATYDRRGESGQPFGGSR